LTQIIFCSGPTRGKEAKRRKEYGNGEINAFVIENLKGIENG